MRGGVVAAHESATCLNVSRAHENHSSHTWGEGRCGQSDGKGSVGAAELRVLVERDYSREGRMQ